MRIHCPVCTKLLDLRDDTAGTLINCPACQQKFVVRAELAEPPKGGRDAPAARGSISDETYELSGGAEDPAKDASDTTPKFCPNCGKNWKTKNLRCGFCRYDLLARRVVVGERRFHLPHVDVQKLYLLLGAAAVGYGLYWLFKNWNTISAAINSIWRT